MAVNEKKEEEEVETTAATAAASSNDDTCELPHKEEEEQKVSMQSQSSQVYFMIGCQRSGSNWLRTMLSEREDLIAPHPPHIMREFMPQLKKFGDLTLQKNLRVCILPLYLIVSVVNFPVTDDNITLLSLFLQQILVDHVVAFVEMNQVPWLDMHDRPMKFDRSMILYDVIVAIECYHFKEMYYAKQEGRIVPERVENGIYLLAVFDAIYNAMAKANGKKVCLFSSQRLLESVCTPTLRDMRPVF